MSLQFPRVQPLTMQRARVLLADPRRQQLLDQIMSATSRQEIDAARHAQWTWLVANPDDFGVLQAGEDLARAEEVLELQEAAQTPRAAS